MILDPQRLSEYPSYDLLAEAARGALGIDRRWLHALIDHPEKTLDGIVQFASEDREDDPIPVDADLISIFHYLRTPRGLPYLLSLIRQDPAEIGDEIAEAIVAIGAPAIEPLLELHRELGDEDGEAVAFLLAGLGIRDARILDLLLQRLDTAWDDGLFHLEIYHDPDAIPELEKRFALATEEETLDLSETIADIREPAKPSAVTEFDIWEFYPEESIPEFDALSDEERWEFLESPLASHREQAARSFFGGDLSITSRVKLLTLAREDSEAAVRGSAWESFFEQTEDPELRNLMLEKLQDPATPAVERAGLALGLADHSDQLPVHTAILEAVENPETRERGLEAMWRSLDPSFGLEALKYVKDPNPEVRRNVIWCLGYLDRTGEARLLHGFIKDSEFRLDALHNYALIAPGATTRKKISRIYDDIDELAGGLTESEASVVETGLDIRLARAGLKPVYSVDEEEEPVPEPVRVGAKIGRNDPCPCGSGKKYKKCCGQ